MNTYYIPTSSLNFNNILSSESISPKAFYAERGFGYRRWTDIPENSLDNAILLYAKPFSFTRPKNGLEDHPMLVWIETEEKFPATNVDGVFYCDHTIYLTPWNVRFEFFCEPEIRATLSLSDGSLETKMNLYNEANCFGVVNKEVVNKNVSPSVLVSVDVRLNREAIEKDIRINKLKGLLYGYYIGAMLSTPEELVTRYNELNDLSSIFSSVLASENHDFTTLQQERAEKILRNMQLRIPAIRDLLDDLQSLGLEREKSLYFIKDNVLSKGWNHPGLNSMVSIEQIENSLANQKGKDVMTWLKNKQEAWKGEMGKCRKLLSPKAEEIIVADGKLKKVAESLLPDSRGNQLMEKWVNEVFGLPKYVGKITLFKDELSDEVTRKAKEICGDDWDGSPWRAQLNNMRKSVRGGEAYVDWKNLLVASMAAVLIKGDDWEQLLSFIRRNSMSDYRIAFAFYGMLTGFANLTRDFTDNLYDISDRSYVANVYKEIGGQLLGDGFAALCEKSGEDSVGSAENGNKSEEQTCDKKPQQQELPLGCGKMKFCRDDKDLLEKARKILLCNLPRCSEADWEKSVIDDIDYFFIDKNGRYKQKYKDLESMCAKIKSRSRGVNVRKKEAKEAYERLNPYIDDIINCLRDNFTD